jgi:hypothetical protein
MTDKEKAKIRAEIIMSLKEGYKPKVKQTAVEWFYQRILAKDIELVFEQAKEMEKEQLKDAYEKGKKYKKPIKDSNPIWLNSKPYK